MTRVRLEQVGDNLYEVYCPGLPEYSEKEVPVRRISDAFSSDVPAGFHLCWRWGDEGKTSLFLKMEDTRVFVFLGGFVLSECDGEIFSVNKPLRRRSGVALAVEEFMLNYLFPRE